MSKTVVFQTIQFSKSSQFSPIWRLDMTLSGVITLGKSGHGSNGNERVIRTPQNSSNPGTSPSNCLVSYPGHRMWGSYPSAENQLEYSTTTADWTILVCFRLVLLHFYYCWFLMPYPFLIYIKSMICNHICKYTQLNDQTVQFLTIQHLLNQQS